jgi:hypothetical protein
LRGWDGLVQSRSRGWDVECLRPGFPLYLNGREGSRERRVQSEDLVELCSVEIDIIVALLVQLFL